MHVRLPLFACLFFASGLGAASAAEIFNFWPGDGADNAAGFQSREPHPCGEVVRAKVSKLPTTDTGPLLSEFAVELSERGKIIGRWPLPVDYVPRALRGEELLATFADKGVGAVWIRPDGAFRKASTLPPADDRALVQCDTSVFGSSASAGCEVFVDLRSRKKRTLGYQGVCS